MIHDLNPWGGQDRSMLEIAWQLNKEYPLEIHSFSIEGYENWPDMNHVPYQSLIKRPIIFKYLNYHLKSLKNLSEKKNKIVQSTGTASLKSDVVQVQFIHHTWQKIAERMPIDKMNSPSLLRGTYQKLLKYYKLQLEKTVYTPEKNYIAISHSIKKELMEHFAIPEQNIQIIYHGVDPTHFYPSHKNEEAQKIRKEIREKFSLKNDFVLLHVGALNSRKGLYKSFNTLSFLKKNGIQNVKLLAVGQGDHEILKKLSKQCNVEDEVILAPHSKDIRNYYWASDCFFFPTFYEPFGLVILEAMACGLPVACSELAGGAELIDNNVNGVLFNPWDKPKEIANVLVPLIRDKNLATSLGEKARLKAEKHNWDSVGLQYRKFYNNHFSSSQ